MPLLAVVSTNKCSSNAYDQRARRVAKRVGLVARRSRWRAQTRDNQGGFMIVDPFNNLIVAGERFDLTAAEVIAFCNE
jgi:hypothetical protein